MNITLIGMAGAGKSTVGKKLAKKLKYKFIDVDKIIEKKNKAKLQKLIDKFGDKKFIKIEENAVLSLKKPKNSIISPGGSAIYSKKAMKFLKKNSKIIYLNASFESINKRLKNKSARGIVGLKNKSLKALYKERLPLYKKYADLTVKIPKDFNICIVIKKIIGEINK